MFDFKPHDMNTFFYTPNSGGGTGSVDARGSSMPANPYQGVRLTELTALAPSGALTGSHNRSTVRSYSSIDQSLSSMGWNNFGMILYGFKTKSPWYYPKGLSECYSESFKGCDEDFSYGILIDLEKLETGDWKTEEMKQLDAIVTKYLGSLGVKCGPTVGLCGSEGEREAYVTTMEMLQELGLQDAKLRRECAKALRDAFGPPDESDVDNEYEAEE